MDNSRRQFLALAGLAPLALMAARQARASDAGACDEPAALSLSPLSTSSAATGKLAFE